MFTLTKRAAWLILTISGAAMIAPPAASQAADQALARAVVDLSSNACYGLASGAIPAPDDRAPDSIDQDMRVVGKMGLTFGVDDRMFKELGAAGQTLASRATMGSKALDGGDVIVTFSGPQPGCRVILLTASPVMVTDFVTTGLAKAGWKIVPTMTAQRSGGERRAFVKRGEQGAPYLMNLWTITEPSSNIRLITTTIRIPAGVAIPPGF